MTTQSVPLSDTFVDVLNASAVARVTGAQNNDVRIVVTEFDFDALPNEWSALVSAGIQIVEAHDRNRWVLGDLARRVAREYGQKSLATYAGEVNVRSSTMYEYHACATFYPLFARATFPSLSWSHYRAAMKLKDYDLALEWLSKAADEGWSADILSKAIKKFLGDDGGDEKVYDQIRTMGTDEDGETPILLFDGSDLLRGKRYRVVIYQVSGEKYGEEEVQDVHTA